MKTAALTLLLLGTLPFGNRGAGLPLEPPKVGFDVLAGFDYQNGMELPKEVTRLHRKRVRVGGFMKTEDGGDGEVACFIIVNDACGCEGTPKLNEMVFCAMPEGETTKIKPGIAEITGTLYVEEQEEDGVVIALYAMAVESVK